MIYLEEKFNLDPATPARLDEFVDFARKELVRANRDYGGRLVAAWFGNVESFFQVTQIIEFDDLAAFGERRRAFREELALKAVLERLTQIAPVRRENLYEPLAEGFVSILHEAIVNSQKDPCESYNLAILQVAPGRMDDMVAGLTHVAAERNLPIVMSWRHVAGNPNEIIDVWRGSLSRPGYQGSEDAAFDADWWSNLRTIAPEERLVAVDVLPYSPLR